MGAPRSITDHEFQRLARMAKAENVRVRYQRRPDAPIIDISPDIHDIPKPDHVDEQEEFTL